MNVRNGHSNGGKIQYTKNKNQFKNAYDSLQMLITRVEAGPGDVYSIPRETEGQLNDMMEVIPDTSQ